MVSSLHRLKLWIVTFLASHSGDINLSGKADISLNLVTKLQSGKRVRKACLPSTTFFLFICLSLSLCLLSLFEHPQYKKLDILFYGGQSADFPWAKQPRQGSILAGITRVSAKKSWLQPNFCATLLINNQFQHCRTSRLSMHWQPTLGSVSGQELSWCFACHMMRSFPFSPPCLFITPLKFFCEIFHNNSFFVCLCFSP